MDPEDMFWRTLVFGFALFLVVVSIGGGFALSVRLLGVAIHANEEMKK